MQVKRNTSKPLRRVLVEHEWGVTTCKRFHSRLCAAECESSNSVCRNVHSVPTVVRHELDHGGRNTLATTH